MEVPSSPCNFFLSVVAILFCKHDKFATQKIQTFTKNAKKADAALCTFCCPGARLRIMQSVLGFIHATRSAVPAAALAPQAAGRVI